MEYNINDDGSDQDLLMEKDDEVIEAYLESIAGEPDSELMETYDISVENPDAHITDEVSVRHNAVSPSADSQNTAQYTMTGRPAQILYLSCDATHLSPYQQLLRKQIEFFEADIREIQASAQGRNKPVVLGQVGIRCRHCATASLLSNHSAPRSRGSVYFPAKLEGIYQMAQNMANTHFLADPTQCQFIAVDVRQELSRLRQSSASSSGSGTGKTAWAHRATALGVYEDSCGLRYHKNLMDGINSMHNLHQK